MIGTLLPLFVAVPLFVAGVLAMFGRKLWVHAVATFAVVGAALGFAVWMVWDFSSGGATAHGIGSWPFGIAIPFAADMFTALMLVVTGLLTVTCVWFALASGYGDSRFFAPLLLVLVAGVNGALLTADIFNMFVFIEVMLLPSYGLFILATRPGTSLRQVAGVRLYVTLNLLTSTVFLIGVGFIYGTAGTVNLGELAGLAAENDIVAFAAAVCLIALGIKAAIVPVHGWLARAYPATSPAVTALFSGLHTKVAIYAIYRLYAVIFDGDARWLWIGLVVFSLTMVIGVFGAVGEGTTRSILAFHMVSQIGYILIGVALFTEAGLTAGIFYLLHHMIVKASLFLSTGAIEVRYGTGEVGKLSGIAKLEPLLAVAFFVAALSLAGIPPFSGFVAKLSLILASLETGQIAVVAVMIFVSLITLLSMLKIWNGVFWGKGTTPEGTEGPEGSEASADSDADGTVRTAPRHKVGLLLSGPAVVLATCTVALGLGGELLLTVSETAAMGLIDTTQYVEAVMAS